MFTLSKALIAILLMFLFLGAVLPTTVPWSECKTIRPNFTTGYGKIVDDLEQHVVTTNHPMRNTRDPGNWVHELTHQINSDLRQQTREHDNCFYVLGGSYVRLMEPDLTLAQVAATIPYDDRGPNYSIYFNQMRHYWNQEPLYVLDETTAYANGLHYHVWSKTSDSWRMQSAKEFVVYTRWLVKAVEKYDPEYKQMDQLKAFVEWNARRVDSLVKQHRKVTK